MDEGKLRQQTAKYANRFAAATGDASDIAANAGKIVHAGLVDEDVIVAADIIVALPEAALDYSAPAAANLHLVKPVLSEHRTAGTQTGNIHAIRSNRRAARRYCQRVTWSE